MKKINLLFAILFSLSCLCVVGCSKAPASPAKPDLDTQLDLTLKATNTMLSKLNLETLAVNGTYGIKSFEVMAIVTNIDDSSMELVTRKDKNEVERKMWQIGYTGEARVDFTTTSFGRDKFFSREEKIKHIIFVYQNNAGKYIYEPGKLELYQVGEFKRG